MNKKIALFALIFLIIPFVYAVSTFVIQETEKLTLDMDVTDPDNDNLLVEYSEPFDQNGEWQTDYGDAGEYGATVTVSDGEISVVEEVIIIVKKKEEAPVIESYTPNDDSLSLSETESIQFSIIAKDFNDDRLFYEWFVDGKLKGSGQDFIFATDLNDAGGYEITVTVSDLNSKISKAWTVEVLDVNVEEILDSIPDIEINENELASAELPDFSGYGLTYSLSGPLGNQNQWQTGYDDAG